MKQFNESIIVLLIVFITWLSYTVNETSKSVMLMEYQMEQIYPVLQELSEK